MILKIVIFLIWIAYSIFEGYREGAYWHYKNGKNKYKRSKDNEHLTWSIQRSFVLFFATMLTGNILYAVVFALSFPFWHDGVYYLRRRSLSFNHNVYRKGFWDFSTTSSAVLTRFNTPFFRTLYFLYSIALFVFLIKSSM